VLFGLTAALACSAAACHGNAPGTGDNGMGDMGTTPPVAAPGQLALRVEQARDASSSHLEIALTLSNGAGGAAAALNPLLFSVRTSDGLYHIADGYETADWVDGSACDPTTQVGGSAYARCTLSINLKGSDGPSELRYSAPGATTGVGDTRTASAMFTVEPCTPCGNSTCTYLDRDKANCGSCGTMVPSGDASAACINGVVTCRSAALTYCATPATPSGQYCVNLQSDDQNCGSCGTSVYQGNCTNGMPTCDHGRVPIKSGDDYECVDLTSNADNCGTPGYVCKDHLTSKVPQPVCRNSKCGGVIGFGSTTNVVCKDKCAAIGLTCDDTWFSGTSGTGNGSAMGGAQFHGISTVKVFPCAYEFSGFVDEVDCGCTS
jgi:hypothetical protein